MDTKNNQALIVDEMAEEDAKLFCSAKRDDQALVMAFKSGLKVGREIAASSEKQGR